MDIDRNMVSFTCLPLSRLSGINRGSEINAEEVGEFYDIHWKNTHLMFPKKLLDDIRIRFFKTSEWYPLGASMTNPPQNGLGYFIQNHQRVWEAHSPRFSSMLAAIMVHKKMIDFRKKGNAFELRKL
ncbi:MAG: hypothetical protein Q7U51_09950 [Methanoregula sp.]|nr:hypothetical protein [Methanoregula sp.]